MDAGGGFIGFIGLGENAPGMLQIPLPGIRGANEARSPREQLYAQTLLECCHRARHRGRRQSKAPRATGKALFFRHRHIDGHEVKPVHAFFHNTEE